MWHCLRRVRTFETDSTAIGTGIKARKRALPAAKRLRAAAEIPIAATVADEITPKLPTARAQAA
jgi:hypothetical protein